MHTFVIVAEQTLLIKLKISECLLPLYLKVISNN